MKICISANALSRDLPADSVLLENDDMKRSFADAAQSYAAYQHRTGHYGGTNIIASHRSGRQCELAMIEMFEHVGLSVVDLWNANDYKRSDIKINNRAIDVKNAPGQPEIGQTQIPFVIKHSEYVLFTRRKKPRQEVDSTGTLLRSCQIYPWCFIRVKRLAAFHKPGAPRGSTVKLPASELSHWWNLVTLIR